MEDIRPGDGYEMIVWNHDELELTSTRDREWQKWPVTIVTGAYLGYAVGRPVGQYLLRGKRIEFDEVESPPNTVEIPSAFDSSEYQDQPS